MSWDQADLFEVPLLDGSTGLGQVVERRDGAALVLLTGRIGWEAGAAPVAPDEMVAVLRVGPDALDAGLWPVAGLEPLPPPRTLREPGGEEVHPPAVVEAFLNAVHGLYPWDGFPDPAFFDGLLLPGVARPEAARMGDAVAAPDRSERLSRQIAFLTEADRLKTVLRATTLFDGSRRENSGEHSWHLALFAMVLAEHSERPVRIDRVIRMLLIHDLVEIDTGDTPIHGGHDAAAMEAAEAAAAERIFGLLPADQAAQFRALWQEFEAAESDDAVFAKSLDRVQPVMANLESGGGTWVSYAVTPEQLETRVGVKVRRGAPALWEHLKDRIDGWFAGR